MRKWNAVRLTAHLLVLLVLAVPLVPAAAGPAPAHAAPPIEGIS